MIWSTVSSWSCFCWLNRASKVRLVKAMVFPVVMYGCESWTVKKAECQRMDAFELWCWRRLLRVPWTARRSNQSILKEISPGSSLEGLMLKLKLQYFGHLMQRADSLEKTLMLKAGEEGGDRGWDGWMALSTRWTWVWVDSRSWWWTGRHGVLQFMGLQRVGHDWVTKLNWTEHGDKMFWIENLVPSQSIDTAITISWLSQICFIFNIQSIYMQSRWIFKRTNWLFLLLRYCESPAPLLIFLSPEFFPIFLFL